MQIVDSDGKLFGYVNIIDALAVLLVVAVGIAGAALVVGSGSDTPQSGVSAEFATVTVGPVSENEADRLAKVESLELVDSDRALPVADVVRTPHPTRDATVVLVRTRLPDRTTELLSNDGVAVSTGQVNYNATVSSLGNRSALTARETPVTVETTVSEQVAAAVSTGDSFRLGSDPVATVTGVQRLGTRDSGRQLRISLDTTVVRTGGTDYFANRPLRLGSSLPFRTDTYSLTGTVVDLGSGVAPRNVSVQAETTVPTAVARAATAGDEFTLDGDPIAHLRAVSTFPVSGSQSRLVMNLSLQATTRADGMRFLGRSVQPGVSVPFRTAEYALEPTVVSLTPATVQRRTLTTRVRTTVPGAVADAVRQGDTYRLDNATVAEIGSVTAYPVSGSTRERLSMTVSLETVLEDGTPHFLGNPVRIGSTVPFETPSYRLDGTVVSRDGSAIGRPTDATLELEWANVPPELADAVEVGMAEQHRGASATITGVDREPATVVLRTETGDIYAREHPVNEDVTLTLSTRVHRQNGRLAFHGRTVQTGDTVTLDFGSVTVDGTVVDLRPD